ncbi:MAG: type II secretion system F family protein [Phycisphaerales bacterium]|nr:type II secretion system F family protein [Phycisphaerales bacterium]
MVPAVAELPLTKRFEWRARRSDGSQHRGIMESETYAGVVRELRHQGLSAVSVALTDLDAKPLERATPGDRGLSARFKRDEVLSLCTQLSVMMKTGVSLVEGLETYAAQTQCKEAAAVIRRIKDDVCEGEDLSVVMAKWPRIFPPVMISLLKAAEATGMMDQMLGRIARDLAKQRKFTRQVKGAMAYPGIMLFVAFVAVTVIMTFVLPKFRPLFLAQGDKLPLITQGLMALADSIHTHWILWISSLATVVVGSVMWARSESGRHSLDWLRLNTPIVKNMFKQLYVVRFAGTMGTLLAAGVSLLEVVKILRSVTGNSLYAGLWDELEERVNRGQDMSTAFLKSDFVPRPVSAMINAGERSGRLCETLDHAAAFAEDELDTAIKTATSLIEPIMILGMGVVVGGIAAAMLLPIFGLSKSIHT